MSICYRTGGGCGPYEMLSCGECPASKPEYVKREETVTDAYHFGKVRDKTVASTQARGMTVYPSREDHKRRHDSNYDRIGVMTVDELIEWYCRGRPCGTCPYGQDVECGIRDWMRQEAEA